MYKNVVAPAFHRAIVILFAFATVFSSCGTVIHYLEPAPHWLDLVLPPIFLLFYAALTLVVWRRPVWTHSLSRIGIFGAVFAVLIPVWHYTLMAYQDPGLRLVDLLPPITSLILLVLMLIIVLFPARQAAVLLLLTWVSTSGPILVYLLTHPDELWSPRGKDLMLAFGPAVMSLLVFVIFQHYQKRTLVRLQNDRRHMQQLAERDTLTGVYNRHGGLRLLEQMLSGNQSAAVVMFDIDYFKRINDIHGHPVGDQVLREVVRRISTVIREDSDLIRWGGEEFRVLLRDVTEQKLGSIAERMRWVIEAEPVGVAGQVTASFGAALAKETDTVGALLARADRALYQAKLSGRNQVVCDLMAVSQNSGYQHEWRRVGPN